MGCPALGVWAVSDGKTTLGKTTAVKNACNSAGLRPVIKFVIFLQGCRARLLYVLRTNVGKKGIMFGFLIPNYYMVISISF
jgi:hypothetical protein